MITADKLALLTNMPAVMLQALITPSVKLTGAKFLGLTNGGQFCYTVTFQVKGGTDSTKLFLSYDPAEDRVFADIHLTEWA
jgi:hypothetical protein